MVAQAIGQGYLPRLRINQTSESVRGQIYVPLVNALLMVGGIALVLLFRSSSALAGSYGFAVSAAMLLTTLAFLSIIVVVWEWTVLKIVAFVVIALPLESLFLAATITKLPAGHYITPIVTLLVSALMATWFIGNRHLMKQAQRIDMPIGDFAESVSLRRDLHRQPRPAVFFQHLPFDPAVRVTPFALLQQVRLTSVLYQPTVVVEFIASQAPRVAEENRLDVEKHEGGIWFIQLTFGYRERVHLVPLVKLGTTNGWWANENDLVYFSARENLRPAANSGFLLPMKLLLMLMQRFDRNVAQSLKLDPGRCVELGVTVEI